MQTDFWRGHRAAGLLKIVAGVAIFVAAGYAAAASKELLTGQGGVAVPLQQVVRVERARGPVSVSVPVAYVFGLGGERSPYYCSPSIRITNSSNAPVEELVVGITYQTERGVSAGSTITRFTDIKIGHQDTNYFYQLSVQDCRGLKGEATILRCMYTTGEDCLPEASVSPFGAIPLNLKPR